MSGRGVGGGKPYGSLPPAWGNKEDKGPSVIRLTYFNKLAE
jgi:hypothetical protein